MAIGNSHRFVDTHCHLDFEAFADDLPALIRGWQSQGVGAFVVPSVSRENWPAVLGLSERFSGIYPALGLHPCFLEEHRDADLAELDGLIVSRRAQLIALGEIGLDARFDSMSRQLFFFEAQLSMAGRHRLPVIVHSVKSHSQVLAAIKRASLSHSGVIHAFSGSRQEAFGYLELGFMIGVGSIICYERARKTREVIASVPLDHLVLETDSPDMALPGVKKGSATPLDVLRIFEVLCELRSEPAETLVQALVGNSNRLFGVDFQSFQR